MKQHIVPSIVASVVASMAAFGAAHYVVPPPVIKHIQLQGKAAHENARVWPQLEQKQIDAITAALRKIKPRAVVIYCDGGNCDDVALDFENALESAHWSTDRLVPIMEAMPIGLVCSDPALAKIIARATGLKVSPMVGWGDPARAALLIGRRPKD
jgi:hypothetical protein